ncbi:MAG TPA: transcription factor S [Candidatus Woesearchaeota archaeon]|nr:transcription factor S [Candidatus Woesearchaeota archaeon]
MNMEMFCSKCGSLLFPKKTDKKSFMYCASCGYASKESKTVLTEKSEEQKEVVVIDNASEGENLPKMEVECPKCGNSYAYFWTMQTRASDEPETKFYKCTKCEHTWRDYS